jgi:peptidoglycan hydrolase-like protein with peptidoglycan-binding domain
MRQRTSVPVALLLVVVLGFSSFAAATASGAPVKRSPTCATLGPGAVGPAVATIQEHVHATPDGEFGPLTAAAVKKWQKRHHVDATGLVDGKTWAALPEDVALEACGRQVHATGTATGGDGDVDGPPGGVSATCAHLLVGSTGPAVKVLQTAVKADVDGEFGPMTAAAVTRAQTKAELRGSGISGPATWAALGLSGTPACQAVPDDSAPTASPSPTAGKTGGKTQHETKHEKAQRVIAQQVVLLAAAMLDRPGTTKNPVALKALHFANKQKGKPYKWGGVGPKSYDCSGLVMSAYAHAGVTIPRVANDQYGGGKAVPLDHARAGDLMFYASDLTNPRSIYHVVMYVGDGTVLDAPQTGSFVGTRAMWTRNLMPVAVRPAVQLDLPVEPGDTGPTVAQLQRALNEHGATLTVDGGYGPKTRKAVDAWKAKHHLEPNGVVRRTAWLKLV